MVAVYRYTTEHHEPTVVRDVSVSRILHEESETTAMKGKLVYVGTALLLILSCFALAALVGFSLLIALYAEFEIEEWQRRRSARAEAVHAAEAFLLGKREGKW